MRCGTLLLEGFCGLKQLKSLYMPTHVARSIGINFWSGGCNGHVLVILLYNPSNSFSLTATRKPAGTYDRAAAVRSMKYNSVTQAVLNFRGISFVTGGWRQNRWRGRWTRSGHGILPSMTRQIFSAGFRRLSRLITPLKAPFMLNARIRNWLSMEQNNCLPWFTQFKISCTKMRLSYKMAPPWKIEFYLTSAGIVWITRIAIGKLPDCISVNDSPSGIGTNAIAPNATCTESRAANRLNKYI